MEFTGRVHWACLPDRVMENEMTAQVVCVFLVFILAKERVWWGQGANI